MELYVDDANGDNEMASNFNSNSSQVFDTDWQVTLSTRVSDETPYRLGEADLQLEVVIYY